MRKLFPILFFLACCVLCFSYACHDQPTVQSARKEKKDSSLYLNHSDTAHYVGINTCKLCHQSIYNTFIKTGMGSSFGRATQQKSAGDFHHADLYDRFSDFHYHAYWAKDSLEFMEFRLNGKDTVFKRIEEVDYIVGSGQHTNSHIQNVNGYLNQMPMTFYTQKKQWDLPPGFEEGHNTRFSRKIGLECMSCHNALPDFVIGSENKYAHVPQGIDCERCHGPGSIHVAQRQSGSKIDTSKYIDYSIVNPAKLPVEAQFDICQRCHLQGNAVVKEGKSFYDFRPGMRLSNVMTVFLSKYKNADDEFIMASHADRLKQSQCFIKSLAKTSGSKGLKPYKDAMTCVTCHNPHVSVRETSRTVFNEACNNCHKAGGKSDLLCSEPSVVKFRKAHPDMQSMEKIAAPGCVTCHMPRSGSIDIPHVTVHDHYIRKPVNAEEKKKIREFLGLFAINEKDPDAITKAKAYINQYEKFDPQPMFLDSALRYLRDGTREEIVKNLQPLVQLYFIRQDFTKIISYVNKTNEQDLLNIVLTKKSYTNEHAWTAYRIADSYFNTGDASRAVKWFEKAVELAPYELEFHNKLGTAYMNVNAPGKAEKEFRFILSEHPRFVPAYTNLGYIRLLQNNAGEAETLYNTALKLDPDYEPLLLNLAGLKAFKKDYKAAADIINRILKKNPGNVKAKAALQQIMRFV